MAQVSAMSSTRTPRTTPRRAATAAPVHQMPEEEKIGVVAYLLQGSAFIGFLLVLFMLAGFRG
ncbi:MAG: hypothetical protein EON47_02980, partial [Acetobacteraceae bacterium]